MNLSLQYLEQPSPAFVAARKRSEDSLGHKLVKFFCDEPRAIGYGEYDALIAENERLRRGVAEARMALAKAFGHEGNDS